MTGSLSITRRRDRPATLFNRGITISLYGAHPPPTCARAASGDTQSQQPNRGIVVYVGHSNDKNKNIKTNTNTLAVRQAGRQATTGAIEKKTRKQQKATGGGGERARERTKNSSRGVHNLPGMA